MKLIWMTICSLIGGEVFTQGTTLLIVFSLALCSFAPISAQDADRQRSDMASQQIAGRGISDQATLRAMRTVPRHLFVPSHLVDDAYDDRPLPIGYGQTISQPYIVAYMTELLRPKRGDRILEIGTGSGYQAAVAAEIADSVFTIEIVKPLAAQASDRLKALGYTNIRVRHADGYHGWEEHAPYDAIIVTAAAEHIPPPLIKQLKEGGRMVIPVGSQFFVQTLILVEKVDGKVTTRNLIPVRFVPFTRRE